MKISHLVIALCLGVLAQSSFAMQLNISLKTPAPTTVPKFGKVSAFYSVTNTENFTLSNIFAKKLPANVSQVTFDPHYCGMTFNLGPHGSATDTCILKLTVKGPVHASLSDLLICTETECDNTTTPLDIALGDSLPFIAINTGSYSDHHSGIFPLLAATNDGGSTWSYPAAIFQDKKIGVLSSASCNNSFDKNVCIAAGQSCTGSFCDNPLPLIAVGAQQETDWQYPTSVFENLQTVIDPHFRYGFFSDVSCKGNADHNFCVATGQYSNDNSETFPLVAFSKDSGNTWTYPAYIHQNLTSTIDPDFAIGSFGRDATSGGELKVLPILKELNHG